MPAKSKPTLDIIVLNYNGWDLLKECLPSVMEEAEQYSGIARVYVLDNASTDKSVENVKQYFPQAGVIANDKNEYMFAYNKAIKNSQAQYVMVLNNDIKLNKSCLDNLMVHFEANHIIFAVQPLFLEWDGQGINGGQRICHTGPERGFFEFGTTKNVTKAVHTIAASGSCIYDRNKFVQLGGYDELFYPAYYEDSDISWRAWDRGWPSLFEPKATLLHKNHATLDIILKSDVNRKILLKSNQLVFMWRHMNGNKFWVRHICLFVPRLMLWDYKNGKFIWTRAAIKAMSKINDIIKRKLHNPQKRTAEEIINDTKVIYIIPYKCT